MAKGLEKMLDRIKEQPAKTLVGRYLSLIAELADEREKSARALDLAEVLVQSDPDEALTVAQMVHHADPQNIRALEIMIGAFNAKGRYGKAEVLRNEIARIESLARTQHISGAASENLTSGGREIHKGRRSVAKRPKRRKRHTHNDELAVRGLGRRKLRQSGSFRSGLRGSAAARLAAGGAEEISPARSARDDDGTPLFMPEEAGQNQLDGQSIEAHATVKLGFDVPASHDDASHSVASFVPSFDSSLPRPAKSSRPKAANVIDLLGRAVSLRESFVHELSSSPDASTLKLDGKALADSLASYQGSEHLSSHAPSPAQERPASQVMDTSVNGHAAQLFDHFWRQGFVDDARALLLQTSAAHAHAAWWQARHELLAGIGGGGVAGQPSRSMASPAAGERAGSVRADKPSFALKNHASHLESLLDEAAPWMRNPPDPELVERLEMLFGRSTALQVSRRLIETLVSLSQAEPPRSMGESAPSEDVKPWNILWQLLEALWGDKPDSVCAELLETLAVHRMEPRFFGLYLDAQLASGAGRKALQVIRRSLRDHPHLAWGRVAWQRVPACFSQLGYWCFTWCEDDGIRPLLQKLEERPRPCLSSLLLLR